MATREVAVLEERIEQLEKKTQTSVGVRQALAKQWHGAGRR